MRHTLDHSADAPVLPMQDDHEYYRYVLCPTPAYATRIDRPKRHTGEPQMTHFRQFDTDRVVYFTIPSLSLIL